MNIFVLSSSYNETLIIRMVSALFANERKSIRFFALIENHTQDEFIFDDFEIPVVLVPTISDALECCEVAFIDITDDSSSIAINKVKRYAKKSGITLIELDFSSDFNDSTPIESSAKSVPTVLLLSIGSCCQTSVYELALAKLFDDIDIKVKCNWSNITKLFLNSVNSKLGWFPKLAEEFEYYDLLLVTVKVKSITDLMNDINLIKTINEITPDYIFVNIEDRINGTDEITNIIKYRYDCQINKIFVSDYFTVLWDNNLIPVKSPFNAELVKVIYDNVSKANLLHDIMNKISYPNGIIPLNHQSD